ncbi:MAG: cyclopropane-fatty-acyl-phospholipid synthase, partial [Frankiaceae bacterium]|nr:cyclopropane-fatty-acyl-phospholipid synthase [Frankiaceae bacterium]
MTLLHQDTTSGTAVNLERWPAMRAPTKAPLRAAIARLLLRRVARRTGIRVQLPDGTSFGAPAGPVLRVRDADAFFTRLGRDGKVGFGEAFMAGDWDSPDVVAVLEPMARHLSNLVPLRLQWLRRFFDEHRPVHEDNDRHGSRRNIARHYDLSNDLFASFLDATMTYSSALFDDPDADEPLASAQGRKIERLLDVTEVRAGTRLLEIGTGWGE